MIRHSVYFKFTGDATEADRERHVADFGELPAMIQEIVEYDYGHGIPDPASGKRPEYDLAHYLSFADAPSLKRYIEHEAHQRFIARNRDAWEAVLVVDSQIA